MSLEQEIQKARKKIISDGYDMSVGEILNLYKDGELKIDPSFQRLFRWDITRKSRFIESILLGIPIPPIFVFQNPGGTWELIDGLQRLSTILEFCGALKDYDGNKLPSIQLDGTKFLPSLANKTWEEWSPGDTAIEKSLQLQIKRARLRVEILLKESDKHAKYELFQRLNTGGAQLSEQEVRNCVAVMINPELHDRFKTLSQNSDFVKCCNLTETAIKKQLGMELAFRLIAFRNVQYTNGLDVHEYLDKSLEELSDSKTINWESETKTFESTFSLIADSLGEDAFKKWDGNQFKGQFLMSVFEVIALGVSKNIAKYEAIKRDAAIEHIKERSRQLWKNEVFEKNSGAGIRGTTRLANLLPIAEMFFSRE